MPTSNPGRPGTGPAIHLQVPQAPDFVCGYAGPRGIYAYAREWRIGNEVPADVTCLDCRAQVLRTERAMVSQADSEDLRLAATWLDRIQVDRCNTLNGKASVQRAAVFLRLEARKRDQAEQGQAVER
jgi:hypothetical protein